jgi:glycosyltransferase involved in cell wall biosynthesis
MPLRVLHVLSGLGQGGIEKWLVNLTAEFQRQHGKEVEFEFLTFLSQGGYYEATLKAMGCRIHHCQLAWRRLPGFVYRLAVQLRRGRYDVVHCHADYLSGLILPVAHAVGVRNRMCHVHATQFAFHARRPLVRHWVGRLLRRLSVWDGGVCIGTSPAAIDAFLNGLKRRMRNQVCVCGIPCEDYRQVVEQTGETIRCSLNWPESSRVILHVGRHTETKNLFLLLEIFEGILRREAKALCVFAGSGALTAALQDKARELGIAQSVQFLGSRDDVPQLMRAADLLLLPSLFEGLGLVVIEAQAVGLRAIISEVIPPEVELVAGLVYRVPLAELPHKWSERALQVLRQPPPDAGACLGTVEASPFNITNSARSLMAVYGHDQ